MEQNVKKTIQFDASPSTTSTTKLKKHKSEKKEQISKVKPQSVKEILLQKLKQYKKEKQMKNKSSSFIPSSSSHTISDSFIRSIQKKKNRTEQNISLDEFQGQNRKTEPMQQLSIQPLPIQPLPMQPLPTQQLPIQPLPMQPQYSNLKNSSSSLPTYRQWKQKTQKVQPIEPKKTSMKINVSKTMKVGKHKNSRKVGIFLKNKTMKQGVEEQLIEMKKCKIKTMKSYLKKNNLIKYGTSAPSALLREIYISSKMCGGVNNKNGTNLIQNYYENEMN